jgi:hypothetical protein
LVAKEKLRVHGETSGVEVRPDHERGDEPVEPWAILVPRINHWFKPIRFPEVNTLTKAHQHVARKLSSHVLIRRNIPPLVIYPWKELGLEWCKAKPNMWRWRSTIAHGDKFTRNTGIIGQPASDETGAVFVSDWSLGNDGVGDDNFRIQQLS